MDVRCRQIQEEDLDAVVALLCRGFSDRDTAYWNRGFARHRERRPPAGYPLYGFLLEAGGNIVGVLLTLHSAPEGDGGPVRCNLSSWYVEPEFRSHGPLLDRMASRRKEVTYLNVSPAPHTWPILEASRYRRYCDGQMLAIPALSIPGRGQAVRAVAKGDDLGDLSGDDRALARDHLGYGCIGFVCRDRDGPRPILVQKRGIGLVPNFKRWGQVPAAQLIYARDIGDVALFGARIGRHLLGRFATPLMVIDARGRIPGLVGRYFPGRAPKFQRGAAVVRLGDLAYTELVLFGP